MPPTPKQRTLVWLGFLVFVVYFMAQSWRGWRYGFDFDPRYLIATFIVVGWTLYWPPPTVSVPRWWGILTWLLGTAVVVYASVICWRPPANWTMRFCSAVMIACMGFSGYIRLHPHGKVWRAFHPAEWGTPAEGQRPKPTE